MPKLLKRPPKYRLHKSTGQAVVSIHGRVIQLGPFGSQKSHARYQSISCRATEIHSLPRRTSERWLDVDLEKLGFGVKAFVTIDVKQGVIDGEMVEALSAIPEVLEVYSVAAPGDLLCQVVARSNEHLMRVLERVLAISGTERTSTAIVLKSQIRQSGQELIEQIAAEAE